MARQSGIVIPFSYKNDPIS